MIPLIHVLIFLMTFKISYGYDENPEGINVGASTSRELTEYEECELWSYVENLARFMLAEDVEGGNLTESMNNRFEELEAFHEEIFSNLVLAENGAQFISDPHRRTARIEYVITYTTVKLLEIIINSCIGHRRLKSEYFYNQEKNAIVLKEYINFTSSDCLCCSNYRERQVLYQHFSLPFFERPQSVFQMNVERGEVSTVQTVQYHIIPLSMLSKFFQVWLAEDLDPSDSSYNGCVMTLLGRLKRSIQKILIVRIKRSSGLLNDIQKALISVVNDPFHEEPNELPYNWLAGNIFLGPKNRGPFNPGFGRDSEHMFRAFEYGVESIIGLDHYDTLDQLFNQLLYFVYQAPEWQLHERLLNGFQIFLEMIMRLNQYSITPFDINQWEEREPSDEELNEVEESSSTNDLRTQKFWAIQKYLRRFERSTNFHYSKVETSLTAELLIVRQLKQKWSSFVMNLLEMITDAKNENTSLLWSRDFTWLYDNYLLQKSNVTTNNCSANTSFDNYLYSLIKPSWNWHRCNNPNLFVVSEWCQAWNRIISSSELTKNRLGKIKKDQKKWSISYIQDSKTIMQWLSTAIRFPDCHKTGNGFNVPHL